MVASRKSNTVPTYCEAVVAWPEPKLKVFLNLFWRFGGGLRICNVDADLGSGKTKITRIKMANFPFFTK